MKTFETLELSDAEHVAFETAVRGIEYPWNPAGRVEVGAQALEHYVLACKRAFFAGGPEQALRAVHGLTTDINPAGIVLLRNMPRDPLPFTPPTGRRSDYTKPTTLAEAALTGISAALGHPIGHQEEKDGNAVTARS